MRRNLLAILGLLALRFQTVRCVRDVGFERTTPPKMAMKSRIHARNVNLAIQQEFPMEPSSFAMEGAEPPRCSRTDSGDGLMLDLDLQGGCAEGSFVDHGKDCHYECRPWFAPRSTQEAFPSTMTCGCTPNSKGVITCSYNHNRPTCKTTALGYVWTGMVIGCMLVCVFGCFYGLYRCFFGSANSDNQPAFGIDCPAPANAPVGYGMTQYSQGGCKQGLGQAGGVQKGPLWRNAN